MRSCRLLSGTCLAIALLTTWNLSLVRAEDSARMVTYQAEGQTYYALSLVPEFAPSKNSSASIVVMFDTSASQQGAYRSSALAALDSMLSSLRPEDQVELLGVDLGVRAFTDGPVSVESKELQVAVNQLKEQVPLGSTDMASALKAAAQRLSNASSQHRQIIYIGDGISATNLLDTATLNEVLGDLRNARATVTSYAIGPKMDGQLLAVLANHTGGNLYVQPEMVWQDETQDISDERAQAENIRNARIAGKQMAQSTTASVLWPTSLDYSVELGQTYPAVMPPLRSDRDTILVGATKDALPAEVDLSIEADGPNGQVTLSWNPTPEFSLDDHGFLVEVVGVARSDEGVSLPTVGSAGLAEAARLVGARMDQLTELAERAVSVGDHQAAVRIAKAVLRSDPSNVRAQTIQHVSEGEPVDPTEVRKDISDSDGVRVAQVEGEVLILEGDLAPVTVVEPQETLLEEVARDGVFLDQVERERRVFAEMLSKEVQNAVVEARDTMSSDPQSVMQNLKVVLDGVQRASDLDAAKRAELVDKLRTTLKEAGYQVTLKDERDREREEELAASQARKLLNERLTRRIEREKQLLARFNALVDDQQYLEAEEVALIVEEIDPEGVTPRVATLWSRHKRAHYLQDVARTARHKAFFDTMYQVELSMIPFPDSPPIIYPDADVWEELTNRRKKYASVDLSARSKSEERIDSVLREPLKVPLQHDEEPLNEVMRQIQDEYDIPIVFDNAALDQLAISPETEVTVDLRSISLRSAMNLMLKQPGLEDLTYVLDQEVLLITTIEKANETLKVKVYPVADLVLPIINLGGLGGGGGGLGGGGLGGGGGGGLGGGGLGGGGGGGLGGGGGGGGGFFNVADDEPAENNAKSNSQVVASQQESASAPSASSKPNHTNSRSTPENSDPASVRRTVRDLVRSKQYDQAVDTIYAALQQGQAQSWMYESLGITMELAGRPKEEIERAIMSACDFCESPEELMLIAQYLAHSDCDARALGIYRQVVKIAPQQYEAYALGLRAAQRAEDLAGIRWATVGVLQHDWPAAQQKVVNLAFRVAKATLEELKEAGEDEVYQQYRTELDKAMIRDVIVRVSWSGDADIDLLVEEPSGTTCSLHEPRTSGGGVSLGDSYTNYEKKDSNGLSEQYRCAKAFPGTYRVRLRKVWGEPVAGKVAVEVYKNYGTKNEKSEKQFIEVNDGTDAMVVFDLEQSRREQPLEIQQLATAVGRQESISRAVLAQQFGDFSDPTIAPVASPGRDVDLARRLALAGQGGAVGFRPIIQVLNDGTQMIATAVISADRRYVRVTAAPNFTGIGNVSTFTFAGAADDLGGLVGGGGGGGLGGGGGGGLGGGGGGGLGGGGGGI